MKYAVQTLFSALAGVWFLIIQSIVENENSHYVVGLFGIVSRTAYGALLCIPAGEKQNRQRAILCLWTFVCTLAVDCLQIAVITNEFQPDSTKDFIAILFAIFLAVYPMIGDGWAQFSNDFNVAGVTDFVSEQIAKFNK